MMTTHIKRKSFAEVMTERIKEATNTGDTLTLISNPLPLGTSRWELINESGKVILGSLIKQDLLDAAKRVGVKVIEEIG